MVIVAELPILPAQPMLLASGVAVAGSLYLIWRLMGAFMRLVFFAAAFAIGFGFSFVFGELTGHTQPLWVYAGEGLALAWVCSLIRAKVARAITAVIVLGLGQISGWFGGAKKPEPAKPPVHAKKSTASRKPQ